MSAKHTEQPAANDGDGRDHVDVPHLEAHGSWCRRCRGVVAEETRRSGGGQADICIPSLVAAAYHDRRRMSIPAQSHHMLRATRVTDGTQPLMSSCCLRSLSLTARSLRLVWRHWLGSRMPSRSLHMARPLLCSFSTAGQRRRGASVLEDATSRNTARECSISRSHSYPAHIPASARVQPSSNVSIVHAAGIEDGQRPSLRHASRHDRARTSEVAHRHAMIDAGFPETLGDHPTPPRPCAAGRCPRREAYCSDVPASSRPGP